MSQTWNANQQAIAYASAKSMLDVFNGSSSAKSIDIVVIHLFNNGTAAVTGVLTTMKIRRITAAAAGSAVTPIANDTSNTALDANTTAGTGRTVTASATLRQIVWSNDEPAVSAATMDEWECLVPNSRIWDEGYGDANVQRLRARTGQAEGYDLQQAGASAVGTCDAEIHFNNV
jgi:hypothetical protein